MAWILERKSRPSQSGVLVRELKRRRWMWEMFRSRKWQSQIIKWML